MKTITHHFETASEHHREGRKAEAMAAYQMTLSNDPEHTSALINIAALESEEGNLAASEKYYRRVLKLIPSNISAMEGLAQLLQKMGRHSESEIFYREVIASEPSRLSCWLNLGTLLYGDGRIVEAVEAFKVSTSEEPSNPKAHSNLGAALLALGRNVEALQSIQEAVRLDPNSAENYLNLAIILTQSGNNDEALEALDYASKIRPTWSKPYLHKATILENTGRVSDAVSLYQNALKLSPGDTEILQPLAEVLIKTGQLDAAEPLLMAWEKLDPKRGNIEFTLANLRIAQGSYSDALTHLKRVQVIAGDLPELLHNMGYCLHKMGDLNQALDLIDQALKTKPDFLDALNTRSTILLAMKEFDLAMKTALRALNLEPSSCTILHNLGIISNAAGRPGDAANYFSKVTLLHPEFAQGYVGLGNAYSKQGDYERAIVAFDKAISLKPNFAEAHYNKSIALKESDQVEEAFNSAWAALESDTNFGEALNALGNTLGSLEPYQIALAFYKKALEKNPNDLEALRHIAGAYEGKRMYDKASEYYSEVLKRDPDHIESLTHIIDCQLFLCDWTSYDRFTQRLIDRTRINIEEKTPVSVDIINLHALPVGNQFTYAAAENRAHFITKNIEEARQRNKFKFEWPRRDRIRIGYLLPYTWFSSMPLVLNDIIKRHDQTQFETFGYSLQKGDDTKFDSDFRATFETFKDVGRSSPERAARTIYDDQIDILIDTTGHTSTTCLPVMAMRPAPIQAHYLGYGLTSASHFLDYLITDPIYTPFSEEEYVSEKIVHLPNTFMATTKARTAQVPLFRKDFDLPEDAFVFCNFNLSVKFEPSVFTSWMSILKRVPRSVMWFGIWTKKTQDNLRKEASARGIDPQRLVFSDIVEHPMHLARLRLADLALDNFYHGGGVTSVDYLWAGLPILTKSGPTPPSRLGSTLVNAAGVPELITHSVEAFELRAVHLANHATELAAIRAKLQKNRETCPLFNQTSYVHHLEEAYKRMFEIYQSGQQPQHIVISNTVE